MSFKIYNNSDCIDEGMEAQKDQITQLVSYIPRILTQVVWGPYLGPQVPCYVGHILEKGGTENGMNGAAVGIIGVRQKNQGSLHRGDDGVQIEMREVS